MSPERKNENGIALIAVLCLVLTASVLVASAVALSQYTAAETKVFSDYSRTVYAAESAAARSIWLLLADKQKYSDRSLGKTDYESFDEERFLADGISHQLDLPGRKAKFSIVDAISGFDISSRAPGGTFLSWNNEDIKSNQQALNEFKGFCNRMNDYTDSDSLLRLNGLEENGYQNKELYNLPRNKKMQFREEILLIPGAEEYIKPDPAGRLNMFRVIPLEKMTALRGRLNLYSAPLSLIVTTCRLSDQETEEFSKAMKEWRDNRTPLSESLLPELLSRLNSSFSSSESGAYTILINTAYDNSPGARLAITLRPTSSAETIQYYEYFLY